MEALILADRLGQELWPLTDKWPVSLLPIANKPLLQLTIEELYQVGVRKAAIISAEHDELVETYFGSGRAFGMELEFIAVDVQCSVAHGLDLAGIDPADNWIAVRGDILRPFGLLEEALARGKNAELSSIFTAMGIALPSSKKRFGSDIRWDAVRALTAFGHCHLSDRFAYYRANMMALEGDVPNFIFPGRPTEQHIAIGQQSVVLAPVTTRRTIIGRNCLVERNVILGAGTIIGDGSIVDNGASVKDSIILPGSYVGPMEVEHAIVDGSKIYCCYSGAIMDLSGSSLAGLNVSHPHVEFAMV